MTTTIVINEEDRILGSMVGGAVGDALGYAVEFDDYATIVRRYGKPGITRYELGPGGKALISDDTQMTLFTAAGCLLGLTRGCCRGIMGRLDCYCSRTYRDWYFTQLHRFGDKPAEGFFGTWLMGIPELYSRRAPGNTCLSALQALSEGRKPQNNSCGCGGVMRVAPIGLICERLGYGGAAQHDAAMTARLTHNHPLGFLPAAVLTLILMNILHDDASDRAGLRKAIEKALEDYSRTRSEDDGGKTYGELWPEDVAKLSGLIRKAVSLTEEDVEDVDAIAQLGEGWTGHEALAIAVYCALKHADNFDYAIVSAVNHSGDSDSTGAVCGNIIGALLGRSLIPSYYTEKLELLDVIEDMANDLYTGCPISEYCDMDSVDKWRWRFKYLDQLYWEPREQMEAHIKDGSLFDKLGYDKKYCMACIKGIEKFRRELKQGLLEMTDESTGKKTWTEKDVESIMKGQTLNVLLNALEFNTAQEYAELLSL